MRLARPAFLLTSLLLATPDISFGATAKGASEPSQSFATLRECCETAVRLAHQDSRRACEDLGSRSKARTGTLHGLCRPQRTADSRWLCRAGAELPCR